MFLSRRSRKKSNISTSPFASPFSVYQRSLSHSKEKPSKQLTNSLRKVENRQTSKSKQREENIKQNDYYRAYIKRDIELYNEKRLTSLKKSHEEKYFRAEAFEVYGTNPLNKFKRKRKFENTGNYFQNSRKQSFRTKSTEVQELKHNEIQKQSRKDPEIKGEVKESSVENIVFSNISTIPPKQKKSSIIIKKKQMKRKKKSIKVENVYEKIQLHLQIIGELGQYSQEMIQLYEQLENWEELAFLVYYQFYHQRKKVALILRKKGDNPFKISPCIINNEELKNLRKSIELVKVIREIENNNKQIQNSLKKFYLNLFHKSESYADLNNQDYRSQKYLTLIEQEINALKDIQEDDQSARQRLKNVYKCYFLIEELKDRPILTFEESLDLEEKGNYLKKAQFLFERSRDQN